MAIETFSNVKLCWLLDRFAVWYEVRWGSYLDLGPCDSQKGEMHSTDGLQCIPDTETRMLGREQQNFLMEQQKVTTGLGQSLYPSQATGHREC